MIQLDDICFAYGDTPVISHFSLTVRRGEFTVIKGDNGCGKSTLLHLLNGLCFADAGTYTFDGEVITEKKMKKESFSKRFHQRIGYVFQNTDTQLFCSRVSDEIAFGPNQMGLPEEEVLQRTEEVLRLLDVEHLRDRAPYQLSMGEKKKVAIGAVLAVNPEVLILDEPMNFLDKKARVWIKDFLAKMKTIGKTIVVVSHTDDFDTLADTVAEM